MAYSASEAGPGVGVQVDVGGDAVADDRLVGSCLILADSSHSPVRPHMVEAERENYNRCMRDEAIQLEGYRGHPYYMGVVEVGDASYHWQECRCQARTTGS